jgi:hypothetical protein
MPGPSYERLKEFGVQWQVPDVAGSDLQCLTCATIFRPRREEPDSWWICPNGCNLDEGPEGERP